MVWHGSGSVLTVSRFVSVDPKVDSAESLGTQLRPCQRALQLNSAPREPTAV